MTRRIVTRLTSLFRRARLEEDLDRELRFHLDMLTEQHVRAGLSPAEARRTALRAFGAVDRVKDDVRDTWLSRLIATLGQDLRYGARNLRRTPGFALVVIATMALGIGANTAIFTVVNGVLLRPLPYRDGERLVILRQQQPLAHVEDAGFSYPEIVDYRLRTHSLEGVVEFHDMWFILLGRPEPERVSTGVVSANFFDVLGVQPAFGRTFQEADDQPGAPAVLMLSYQYWQRSFGGDPSVVGRIFQMNDRPHQVVGILPPVPQYPKAVDVYMPTSACPFRGAPEAASDRRMRMMMAFARVKPGVTLEKARADLAVVAAGLQAGYPQVYKETDGYRVTATPLQEELTRSFKTTLFVLLGTAGFVLLIVCASVANLTLARIVGRQREMAIRGVLGASRVRLLRQLLTESTVLALAGGVLGVLLAGWGVDLLVAYAERFTPRAADIRIDQHVLLYTFVVSVATGLIFGSVPALTTPIGIAPALRDGGRATQNRNSVRNGLIVMQVAASFMLLIGAGLTLRTVINLQRVDPGFNPNNLLTMRIDLNFSKYRREQVPAFWERLEERLQSEPGVLSAGGGGTFPLNDSRTGLFTGPLQIEGRPLAPDAPRPQVDYHLATPDYFSTIGQPLVSGRPFRPTDRAGEPEVVAINRAMARHYWPGQDPVGKRIRSGDDGWATIVGVVADTLQQLDEPARDEVYVPMLQARQLSTTWIVRTGVDPAVMERQIRGAVRAIDPEQPVDHFRTLAEVRSASLESPRLTAALLGLFALLALVITAAGIAGVIAFSVNQRTQEFGIRMALGARRGSVLGMVLRQGISLVLVGLAIGMAGAVVLTRVLTTLLFGVQPTDALTFLAVSMVLVAVAAAACLIPARRAASVDPMVALRVG
ncbi:MAG: ABC transporter permease [Acidobacteriota bacterium]